MTHSASATRMGNAMLEVLLEDFRASGYIAMFDENRKRFTIKADGKILTICAAPAGASTHVDFIVSDVISGRTETVTYVMPARGATKFKVQRDIAAQWELDMLWVANTLAVMLDKLYQYYTIDGKRKELHQGGNGYSSIAKDSVASEWDRHRAASSLGGGAQ